MQTNESVKVFENL